MSSSTAIIFILLGSFLIVGTSLEAVVCAPGRGKIDDLDNSIRGTLPVNRISEQQGILSGVFPGHDKAEVSLPVLPSSIRTSTVKIPATALFSCSKKTLRATGNLVEINLPSTPDGIICIGNRENPSPSHNFILFEKADEELTFLGTESRNGSFIDLRPYVTWVLSMSSVCEMKPGCKKLPPHMRGILPPSNATRVECSREKPNGEVQFFCGHNGAVDDDGALTILTILPDRTETLWY